MCWFVCYFPEGGNPLARREDCLSLKCMSFWPMRVACLVLVWAPGAPEVDEIGCVGPPESLLGRPIPQGVYGFTCWEFPWLAGV